MTLEESHTVLNNPPSIPLNSEISGFIYEPPGSYLNLSGPYTVQVD